MVGPVTTQVVVDQPGLSAGKHLTVLELRWESTDPLAVTMRLTAQPDHPSLPHGQWVMLRDFLRYGMEHPTGDGMVRVEPIGPTTGRVRITLLGGPKPYVLDVGKDVIVAFLDETESLVPAGEEASDTVMDELIQRLLEY